jgi:acylphosphatase
MSEQVRLLITGRVQGVFFRTSTRKRAKKLGLNGWVRNLTGGQVEVLAEGESEAVKNLIAWCHIGPPSAYVEEVKITSMQSEEQHHDFYIR